VLSIELELELEPEKKKTNPFPRGKVGMGVAVLGIWRMYEQIPHQVRNDKRPTDSTSNGE